MSLKTAVLDLVEVCTLSVPFFFFYLFSGSMQPDQKHSKCASVDALTMRSHSNQIFIFPLQEKEERYLMLFPNMLVMLSASPRMSGFIYQVRHTAPQTLPFVWDFFISIKMYYISQTMSLFFWSHSGETAIDRHHSDKTRRGGRQCPLRLWHHRFASEALHNWPLFFI